MHDTKASIEGLARTSFNGGFVRKYPVYLSTKNTIFKAYDGMFKDVFQDIFDAEFKAEFDRLGLIYEHRLIDGMVASARSSGTAAMCGPARTMTATCRETSWRRDSAASA